MALVTAKINWSKNIVFNKESWKEIIFLILYNKQKLIKKSKQTSFQAPNKSNKYYRQKLTIYFSLLWTLLGVVYTGSLWVSLTLQKTTIKSSE